MRWMIGWVVVVVCAVPGLARAQANAAEFHHAPSTMPDLVNPAGAGMDLFVAQFDDIEDVTVFTVEPYVVGALGSQVFVWGAFPLIHARGDGDSISGWGNLTGGAYFVQNRDSAWFGGGASLSLPTAEDDETEDAFGAALFGGVVNIDDLGRYFPDFTTVRIHGDVRGETGNVFGQAQLRVDHFSTDGDDATELVLGIAAGANVTPATAVIGEIHVLSDALDDDALNAESFHLGLHTGGGAAELAFRISYIDVGGLFGEAYGIGVDSRVRF